MIDVENQLFQAVATALRARFPSIYVTGEYVRSPASFPCVSIEEKNNTIWRNGRDSSTLENFAEVMYEINVYSNKSVGKKTECKTIAAFIDETLANMGFTRIALNPIPNAADATIYRMVGRYRAIVAKDGENDFLIYKR